MTRARLFALLTVLGVGALLAGHGLPGVARPEAAPGALVAQVGDRQLTGADLSTFLYDRQREVWLRAVDDLVDETIVRREASRLGVLVPPEVVRAAVAEEKQAREAALQATYGEDVSLAEEIERAYGLTLEAWQATILAPRVELQHLLMRIVRLDTRRRPRLEVRVIVLADEGRARLVLQKLAQGADFSLTAVNESVDPTARRGGELPAIARGDLAWPEVEAQLFQAALGQVIGPLAVQTDTDRTWHLYKVLRRIEAWQGGRAELLRRLEEDLEKEPLARPEFERWRARTRRDFSVRVLAPDGRPLTDPGR